MLHNATQSLNISINLSFFRVYFMGNRSRPGKKERGNGGESGTRKPGSNISLGANHEPVAGLQINYCQTGQ